MKLTTTILIAAMTTGVAAWAQNPDVIENTKNTVNAVGQKAEMDRNAVNQASSPSPTAQPVAQTAETSKPATAKPAAKASGKKAAPAAAKKPAPTKLTVAPVAPQPKQGAQKVSAAKKSTAKKADPMVPPAKSDAKAAPAETAAAASDEAGDGQKAKKTITAEGRRDPFVNPVVSRVTGPSCSTGKRCLAIDQIMVRGVVRSDTGMIAVVVNSLNKAYFLKENDPVYNGYVLRITGDSVVFKETFQDRLGKESTREVVKKLTTPAV